MSSIPKSPSTLLLTGILFLLGAFSLHGNCGPTKRAAVIEKSVSTSAKLPTTTLEIKNATGSDTVNRTAMVATSQDIVPADRLYDWGAYCGVPGGIPNSTTTYRTMTPSNTAAEINAAIAACPSGQVVYLTAGTYNLGSSYITFPTTKSGVTLRGAGPGKTILTGTSSNFIRNSYTNFVEANGIALAQGGGYTKGSTSITLASSPSAYFAPGNLMVIGEDQSRNKFGTDIGTYTRDGLTTTIYSTSASRCFKYLTRITSVVGNTINLASPLPLDFTYSLNPKAYAPNGNGCMSLCGIENLTLYNCIDPIRLYNTDRCWVKNVEFSNCPEGDIGFLQLNSSFQFEMRRCYLHDASGYPNQVDGMGVGVNYGVCNGLFIDNISYQTSAAFEINGAAANAFLYNYGWSTARAAYAIPSMFPMFYHHGPHSMMNLFEGNIFDTFMNDGYHGSGSHEVVFRNNINGLHPLYTQERKMINLPRGSYYHSVVGNVLGDSSWNPTAYVASGSYGHTESFIYCLGYPNSGNSSLTPAMPWSTHPNVYPDPAVESTLLRHGNYDYYNRDVIWDSGISSRAIPDSLFYPSKPAFFGSLQWPPIGPDVSGLVTNTPAKARWNAYLTSGNPDDLFNE
jgi:hypothetical protein